MRSPTLPKKMYDELATLETQLHRVAADEGEDEESARKVIKIVPPVVRGAPTFRCRLTGLWRYEFGLPLEELADAQAAVGTHMFTPVHILFRSLLAARRFLTEEQLKRLFARLSDPSRHQDVLAEFLPALRVGPEIDGVFEVGNYGVGNHTIDWYWKKSGGVTILLEVKNRLLDLVKHLVQIGQANQSVHGEVPPPATEPAMLFRDTFQKFTPRQSSEILQGVWIVSLIKQEKSILDKYFLEQNPDQLHFAVLTNWNHEAYFQVRDERVKSTLIDTFGLSESDVMVFTMK